MNLVNIKKELSTIKGFTLIELLLVITILSILLVVVFAALNPAKRLQDTRNARRWSDINEVLTAIHECIVDNDLATCGLPASGTLAETQLGTCTTGGTAVCTGAAAACLNLTTPLANYIASIPLDPSGGTASTTNYAVTMSNGIITVSACGAEGGQSISVSR